MIAEARALHLLVPVNLRCTFHIRPSVQRTPAARAPVARNRMPSVAEIEVEVEPMLRGRSHETWARARNWASED